MTEAKFMKCILSESILLLFLGFGMLILPKITIVSFGLMMCISFILYGLFKIGNSIIIKNFSRHFVLDIILGLIITSNGVLLLTAPAFDIMLIIGLSGIFFILKSISSAAFSVQTRKTLNFWWMCMLLSVFELFPGFIVIIMLPSAALWFIGILTGIDFILSGIILMNMYIATKYIQG